MPETLNQKIERYYFNEFYSSYNLPEGNIVYDDRPDVIVNGEKKIGIEITNFYLDDGNCPTSEEHQKKLREYVVSTAHQQYIRNGGKKFELSFSFEKSSPITDKKTLAKKLVSLAKKVEMLSSTGNVSNIHFTDIPELSHVYLNKHEYEDAKWRIAQCHSVSIMASERLGDIIRTKEKKAEKYQKCDAYWLLIVVDFINPAQDTEITSERLEGICSGVFEKIIIYKTCFREVFEISQFKKKEH